MLKKYQWIPEEYNTFIKSVNSRPDPYTIEEIECRLLVQEAKIERHSKDLDATSINIANT